MARGLRADGTYRNQSIGRDPRMSRRHFELIAQAISDFKLPHEMQARLALVLGETDIETTIRLIVIDRMCDALQSTNPDFSRSAFMGACMR